MSNKTQAYAVLFVIFFGICMALLMIAVEKAGIIPSSLRLLFVPILAVLAWIAAIKISRKISGD
jgi:hypothetical protein